MLYEELRNEPPIGQNKTVYKLLRTEREWEIYGIVDNYVGDVDGNLRLRIVPDRSTIESYEKKFGRSEKTNERLIKDTEKSIKEFTELADKIKESAAYCPNILAPRQCGSDVTKSGCCVYTVTDAVEPMTEVFASKRLNAGMIINMWTDILKALSVCEDKGIIHGEIESASIYINKKGGLLYQGRAMLGGFGERQLNRSMKPDDKRPDYFAAPEYVSSGETNSSTDLYALGSVVYRLFNFGRMPFMPSKEESYVIPPGAEKKAYDKLTSGETLPAPAYASSKISEVILKCCDYDKSNRYSCAKEVLQAVEELKKTENMTAVISYPSFSAFDGQSKEAEKTSEMNKEINRKPDYVGEAEKTERIYEVPVTSDTDKDSGSYTHGAQEYYNESIGKIKNNRKVKFDEKMLGDIDELSRKVEKKYGRNSKEYKKFKEKINNLEDVKEVNKLLKKGNKRRTVIIRVLSILAGIAVIIGVFFLMNTKTYYANQGQFHRIYSRNLFGKAELFNGTGALNLEKKGNTLYFINTEDMKIYTLPVKKDSNIELLGSDVAVAFEIQDDYLYYINSSDYDRLYRRKLDGSGRECVFEKCCKSIEKDKKNIKITLMDNPEEQYILDTGDLSVEEAIIK